MADQTLNIRITADSQQATGVLGGLRGALGGLGDIVKTGLGVAGGVLGAGVVTGLADIGKNAIGTGINFLAMQENAKTAFTTMLGDGQKAEDLLKGLQTFSASTPFEFPEIAGAAKSLLAFGVGAGDMTVTLQRVGDIASGVGAPLGDIAELYGKAKVQGRLFSQDINQLTGRGIPIIQQLAKQFGVADSEVMKLVESGKVGFPNLEQAFKDLTGTGGQFNGMMDAQSKTFDGMMSTLKDNLAQLAGTIMAPLFDLAKQAMAGLIGILNSPAVSAALENFSSFISMMFGGIADALANGDIAGAVGVFVADILQAFGVGEDAAIEFSHIIEDAMGAITNVLGGLFSGGGAGGPGAYVSGILTSLQGAFQTLMDWLSGSLAPALADAFGQIAEAAGPALEQFGGFLNTTVIPALQTLGGLINGALAVGFQLLGEFIIKTALPALTTLGVWIFTTGLPALGGLANQIGGALNAAFGTAVDLWGKFVRGMQDAGGFINDVKSRLDDIASVISGGLATALAGFNEQILQPILSTFQGIATFIQDVIDKLRDLADLLGMNVSGLRDAFGAMIPHYAAGGPVRAGQLSLVGEEGPELFLPGTSGTIIPSGRFALAGGGPAVQFVYAPTFSLADRYEAEHVLRPVIENVLRTML